MDILYIVGKGLSSCNNNELRYSLRSVEKYGINVDRVFVAGYCPDWLSNNVVKVPFEQPYPMNIKYSDVMERLACKHANIISTILYTIDNTDIGDEFLVSMDDHFYIRDVDFNNYPYYVKGEGKLKELPVEGESDYARYMASTRQFLKERGLSVYYLVPHRNMHCSRRIFEECRNTINTCIKNKVPIEYLCYLLNYQYTKYGFELIPTKDVKVKNGFEWYKLNPEYTEVFSTVDYTPYSRLDDMIRSLYKNKSKYEA